MNASPASEPMLFQHCYGLASITIPNSVTSIAALWLFSIATVSPASPSQTASPASNNAFQHCYGLASITIPNSVTSIEPMLFSIATVSPASPFQTVSPASRRCFWRFLTVASITIPNSVTSIGRPCFSELRRNGYLRFLYSHIRSDISINERIHGIPSDCIMKIPSALFATWETAQTGQPTPVTKWWQCEVIV